MRIASQRESDFRESGAQLFEPRLVAGSLCQLEIAANEMELIFD